MEGGGRAVRSAGSSPRVRGTPVPARRRSRTRRIIPAGAGNATAAHPTATRPERRIIPAGAGNALRCCASLVLAADHPRGCGERAAADGSRCYSPGSSPRVRGTLHVMWVRVPGQRIIPAGAGNAARRATSAPPPSDHPRGCGERRLALEVKLRGFGSSPRVRGTPDLEGGAEGLVRIIPAGAGNAMPSNGGGAKAADHPRGCGERDSAAWAALRPTGSSPRVRGTHAAGERQRRPQRIIPAGAGNAGAR